MTQTASLAAFFDPLMLAFVCGLSLVVAWMQNGSATLVSAFRVLAGDLWRNQDRLADQAHRGFLITEHLVAERGISCADRTRSDSAFMRMAADLLANNRSAEQFHQALERKLARQGGSMAGATRFWDNVADAAPAMGLLGTVTGLILLFGKVDDASAIGSAMAISLLSSLYGLILSNLIAAPLARRLAHVDAERQKWQSDVIRRLDELARREYADLRDLPSQDTDPASEKTETEPHSGIVSLGRCEELGKGVAFKKAGAQMNLSLRTTLSFLDLALIMVGVMALLLQLEGRDQTMAATALAGQFGEQNAQVQVSDYPLDGFFEAGEARLSAKGKSTLRQDLAKVGDKTRLVISVPMDDAGQGQSEADSRFSRWEISAARTAAIMHFLAAQGVSEEQMRPVMADPSREADKPAGPGQEQDEQAASMIRIQSIAPAG